MPDTPVVQAHDALIFLDLETTGLSPSRGHRIVEVAALLTTLDGRTTQEYVTLVNPTRGMAASEIHGITDELVSNAPIFAEIAGDLVHLLRQGVWVGHNVAFDQRFIEAELSLLNMALPPVATICTMALAANQQLPERALAACCRHYGIEAGTAHCALADARAAKDLYFALCRDTSANSFLDPNTKKSENAVEPKNPADPAGKVILRSSSAAPPTKPSSWPVLPQLSEYTPTLRLRPLHARDNSQADGRFSPVESVVDPGADSVVAPIADPVRDIRKFSR